LEKLIKEEINRIHNLEERIIFKDLLNDVFLALYENNQNMYKQLEDKVLNELNDFNEKFVITTGLVEKRYFDKSHHLFAPILDSDIEDKDYSIKNILEILKSKGKSKIMHIFLEMDYLEIKTFLEKDNILTGKVITDTGEYDAKFRAELSLDYVEIIDNLYKTFNKNGIKWNTIPAMYVFKFIDIYMVDCDEKIYVSKEFVEVNIDFNELKDKVKCDMVPLWNVRKINSMGVGFPTPCVDHVNYEHTIKLESTDIETSYLVRNTDVHLQNINRYKENMIITCLSENVQEWNLYQIRYGEYKATDHFSYEAFGNKVKENIMDKLANQSKVVVKTESELIRFINDLGIGDYLKYKGYEISDNKRNANESYSMNPFIDSEIRDMEAKKYFAVRMKTQKEEYFLNRDILSYVVSEVQMILPEYECIGVLE
jgi:hypothetical protein